MIEENLDRSIKSQKISMDDTSVTSLRIKILKENHIVQLGHGCSLRIPIPYQFAKDVVNAARPYLQPGEQATVFVVLKKES